MRQLAGREEQVLEVLRRRGHRLVREVDQHDEHAHLAAQRGPFEGDAPRHPQRGAERQIAARLDQAVVVAAAIERDEPDLAGRQAGPIGRFAQLVLQPLLRLGAGRDLAALVEVAIVGTGIGRLGGAW